MNAAPAVKASCNDEPARRTRRGAPARLVFVAAALGAGLAIAVPAVHADVLVNAPAKSVPCRTGIKVGVWYQSHSGGPKWARIAIRTAAGTMVWRRRVTATTRWRYWRYRGTCDRRYTVSYETSGGRSRFTVRIRAR